MSQRRERGFTLVELMVVIVILGALVSIVGLNVFEALGTSSKKQAQIQMSNFGDAITRYVVLHRKLPGQLEDLTQPEQGTEEPLLRKIPKDPWDREYQYKLLGNNKYEIRSLGEKEADDSDDVVFPETE